MLKLRKVCLSRRSGSHLPKETGIPELKRTTRDEPDYDKLMKYRNILKEHGLGLKEIQETIARVGPTSRRQGISGQIKSADSRLSR